MTDKLETLANAAQAFLDSIAPSVPKSKRTRETRLTLAQAIESARADKTRDALAALLEESRDWQEALCGERPSLDSAILAAETALGIERPAPAETEGEPVRIFRLDAIVECHSTESHSVRVRARSLAEAVALLREADMQDSDSVTWGDLDSDEVESRTLLRIVDSETDESFAADDEESAYESAATKAGFSPGGNEMTQGWIDNNGNLFPDAKSACLANGITIEESRS